MCNTIITPDGLFVLDEQGHVMFSIGNNTNMTVGLDKGIKITSSGLECNNEMEDKNMERNKVLDLYVERKRKALKEEYEKNYMEEYNNLPVVKEYNEIVGNFEAQLAELSTRELAGIEYLGYKNDYGYVIKSSVSQEIKGKHYDILRDKMNDVDNMENEVQALLSLSDDKDYQIEVLVNYGILDKKTKTLTI